MKNNIIVIVVGVAIVVGGGGFYAGMKYGQSKTASSLTARFQQGGFGQAGRTGGRQNGAGVTAGEILSKDATSITIKMRDGGSKIVFLSEGTQVMKAATGSTSDLMIGAQVTAMGTANPDGSVTAQSVQIRPNMPKTDITSGTQPEQK